MSALKNQSVESLAHSRTFRESRSYSGGISDLGIVRKEGRKRLSIFEEESADDGDH